MKKLTGFLLAILAFAVVSISFTSCGEPEEPDNPNGPNVSEETRAGVYNPGRKISKIYVQKEGEQECLLQKWTWDKNRLASITHYSRGVYGDIDELNYEYIYEGNRLLKFKVGDEFYCDFFYNGPHFEKIEYRSSSGKLVYEYHTFQYEGDKISEVTYRHTGYGFDKKQMSTIEGGFMGTLLSQTGVRKISEETADPTKEFTNSRNFFYEGENLVSIKMGGYDTYMICSDYDTHFNAYYNFIPIFVLGNGLDYLAMSKNNPGKVTIYPGIYHPVIYTYTYDHGYPVTIQKTDYIEDNPVVTITRIEYQ